MDTTDETLIAASPHARSLIAHARELAARDTGPVLILGETGTGKTALAQYIHEQSRRAGRFEVVNCGALSRELAESRLFGHEKGSYTGAITSRLGAFRSAHGGTLLLDEIGDLPLDVQVALLHVIECRQVLPLGSDKPIDVDVRLIAATWRPLETMVQEGRFRRDLFWRLHAPRTTLTIPPLRERPDDVLAIARSLSSKRGLRLSADAETMLVTQRWEGNVRELIRTVEVAAAWCGGTEILGSDLIAPASSVAVRQDGQSERLLWAVSRSRTFLDAAELLDWPIGRVRSDLYRAIVDALFVARGNRARAAKALGWSRGTLLRRMDALGVEFAPNSPGRPGESK